MGLLDFFRWGPKKLTLVPNFEKDYNLETLVMKYNMVRARVDILREKYQIEPDTKSPQSKEEIREYLQACTKRAKLIKMEGARLREYLQPYMSFKEIDDSTVHPVECARWKVAQDLNKEN